MNLTHNKKEKNIKNSPLSTCNVGDLGSIPGSGRSPGEGNGNPLQHSCLENPMDGGASPWGPKEWDTTERLVENYPRKKMGNFKHVLTCRRGFPGSSVVKNPPANAGDVGSVLGLGRSPGEGNGNPLQYSCQGKLM